MDKYQKAIKEYMKKKNEVGVKLFGHPFYTEEELKILLSDKSISFKEIIEEMEDFTEVTLCPYCIKYLNRGCNLCQLSARTGYLCEEHPIEHNIGSCGTIVENLLNNKKFTKAFNKLKRVLND